MSKLVLHIPGGGTRDIKLDRDRITIGRRADNDVHLPYPAVSAEHAAIITVLDDSFLEDLQSTNGTLVNGKRVTKHFLRDHDAIDIGRVQLVYVMNDDEVLEPLPSSRAVEVAPSSVEREEQTNDSVAVVRTSSEYNDHQREEAPVERFFAELMSSGREAALAVEIPPTTSIVPERPHRRREPSGSKATAGVYLEVMSGPNAGQIAPMTRQEFRLGRAGVTLAVIRREKGAFAIVPSAGNTSASVNGTPVPAEGLNLAFGDAIDVGGVKLLFARRPC